MSLHHPRCEDQQSILDLLRQLFLLPRYQSTWGRFIAERSDLPGWLEHGCAQAHPWDGKNELQLYKLATCHICGREVAEGITLGHDGEVLGFCSNRYYVQ